MFRFRRSAAIVLTSALAVSTILSASAASTTKSLSSNFTLVNLIDSVNSGQIQYVKDDGSQWRPPENFDGNNPDTKFNQLGDQLIRAQYFDNALTGGSGSVVVSTEGPVGAVVQIQAREQTPTSGAYIGVGQGAQQASVPLVSKGGTSGSGINNSQIIVQNASQIPINVEVELRNLADGQVVHTNTINGLQPNQAQEYDLSDEAALPTPWFGSAVIRSTTANGEVAVVSNLFQGPDSLLTFNAFTEVGQAWYAPLFASRLTNGLSTPITVQNVSGSPIPPGGVDLICTKTPGTDGDPTIERTTDVQLDNNASFAFNPAADTSFPAGWVGSCRVNTDANTVMFVQMRFIGQPGNNNRAGAYEGILASGTDQVVVVPLYAKRLGNGFASAVTIQNLSTSQAANVTLAYKGATGSNASCTQTFSIEIPAGANTLQNHRLPNGPDNIPSPMAEGCVGTLTVTSSNAPIDAFVQLDFLTQDGDPFMAHNVFTLAAN